jgi:hypothetical protein
LRRNYPSSGYGKAPILVLAAIALILPPLVASQKLAEIFVYVPWDPSQHSRLTVFLDGTPAAEIQPGRFFLINADSGRHVLMAGDASRRLLWLVRVKTRLFA